VLIDGMRNIIDVLAGADPADKAQLYGELGVKLRYEPSGKVSVEALADGRKFVSEGRLVPEPHALRSPADSSLRREREALGRFW